MGVASSGMTTTPYIPQAAGEVPRRSNGSSWAKLEAIVLAELAAGPKDTKVLKQLGVDHGYTEDQVSKLIAARWMNLPRHPGRAYYDPWTVYHPFSPHADRLGISHAIDKWLVAYMGKLGKPVASAQIERAAVAAGFDIAALKTAYRRCQAVATKKGGHWYRHIDQSAVVPVEGIR